MNSRSVATDGVGSGSRAMAYQGFSWVTVAFKKIIFAFESRISRVKEFSSWLN